MTEKLSNLVEVIYGYSFREAIKEDIFGNYRVVQVRDIKSAIPITEDSELITVNIDRKSVDAVVFGNDVLLATRGTEASGLRAGIYLGNKSNIVASSSLYILRVTNEKILPQYLLYYLNSFYGQRSLKSIMSGAMIQTILKKDLLDFAIPIPNIKKQQIIVDAVANILQQKKMHQKKINVLNTLTDNIISIYN